MPNESKIAYMLEELGDGWIVRSGVGLDGEYLELVRGATTVSWLKDGDPMPYAARTRYGGLTWASGSAETPRAALDAMIEDGKKTLACMAEDLGTVDQSIRQMAGELDKVALPSIPGENLIVYETLPIVLIGSEEHVLRKKDE